MQRCDCHCPYYVRCQVKYIYDNKLIIIFCVLRYIGYSHIYCAWYAFPFEALEVFTFFSLQVLELELELKDVVESILSDQ